MESSRLQTYLAGRVLPGDTAPVKTIKVSGDLRVLERNDGSVQVFTKAQMLDQFNAVLSAEQRSKALRGLRTTPTGAKVTVGGERKVYVSASNARKAVERYYGPYLKPL